MRVSLDRPPIIVRRGSIARPWVTPAARKPPGFDGQAAARIARPFVPPHVQKDTLPLLPVRNTILHCRDNGVVDWQMKRPERRMIKPHPSSRLHVLRFCMRLCMLTVAGMASRPFSVDADTGRPPL
jgi:hypothetical protein